MSNHTPGPWLLQDCRGEHTTHGIRARGENVSGYVAFINAAWPHEVQRVEQLANARLLAAAPDLYEALKAQRDFDLAHCGTEGCWCDVGTIQGKCRELKDRAVSLRRSAIAKVEGREP